MSATGAAGDSALTGPGNCSSSSVDDLALDAFQVGVDEWSPARTHEIKTATDQRLHRQRAAGDVDHFNVQLVLLRIAASLAMLKSTASVLAGELVPMRRDVNCAEATRGSIRSSAAAKITQA